MSVEIKVPTLGESVTEATIAKWLKQAGDAVAADEPLVELETDKVSLEVPAPSAGVLSEILVEVGTDVEVGAVIGRIEAGDGDILAQPEGEWKRFDHTAHTGLKKLLFLDPQRSSWPNPFFGFY